MSSSLSFLVFLLLTFSQLLFQLSPLPQFFNSPLSYLTSSSFLIPKSSCFFFTSSIDSIFSLSFIHPKSLSHSFFLFLLFLIFLPLLNKIPLASYLYFSIFSYLRIYIYFPMFCFCNFSNSLSLLLLLFFLWDNNYIFCKYFL